MQSQRRLLITIALVLSGWIGTPQTSRAQSDPLPSWNEGAAKQSIIDFVRSVTDESSQSFVKPDDRIAVFDNDGTLWCEQPMYTQILFAMDQARAAVQKHPNYKQREIFQKPIKDDPSGLIAGGARASMELIASAHEEMTTDEFEKVVEDWLQKSKHPRFKTPFTQLLYVPMLEVLTYLRANGFKTYIVSGGGIEFMRPWTEKAYGIPPEQIIGSNCLLKYKSDAEHPSIIRTSTIEFIDDGDNKPVAIEKIIGRRPIVAGGNSDGDRAMLEWTTTGPGKRLAILVHHTDQQREYAYDRDSKIGHLDKALQQADAHKWTVVDVKKDWKRVFPFQQ